MYAIWTKTKQTKRWSRQFEIPLDIMDKEYHMLSAELLHEDDPDTKRELEKWLEELEELREMVREGYTVYFTPAENITTHPADGGYRELFYPHYVAMQKP